MTLIIDLTENELAKLEEITKTIFYGAEIDSEVSDAISKLIESQPCEDCISKEKMIKVIERMEKLEEDLYRTEGAESSFATLCLCVEWIKEALE